MVESLSRFRIYILGKPVIVVTDCQAVVTLKSKTEIVPRVARWLLRLQEFYVQFIHRPGTAMSHVDGMNRNPVGVPSGVSDVDGSSVYAI